VLFFIVGILQNLSLSIALAHAALLFLRTFILFVSIEADKLVDNLLFLPRLLNDDLKLLTKTFSLLLFLLDPLTTGFQLVLSSESVNVDESWSSDLGSALRVGIGDYTLAKLLLRPRVVNLVVRLSCVLVLFKFVVRDLVQPDPSQDVVPTCLVKVSDGGGYVGEDDEEAEDDYSHCDKVQLSFIGRGVHEVEK